MDVVFLPCTATQVNYSSGNNSLSSRFSINTAIFWSELVDGVECLPFYTIYINGGMITMMLFQISDRVRENPFPISSYMLNALRSFNGKSYAGCRDFSTIILEWETKSLPFECLFTYKLESVLKERWIHNSQKKIIFGIWWKCVNLPTTKLECLQTIEWLICVELGKIQSHTRAN